MRFHAAVCAGVYMPGQAGVMRASAETQVISANTIAGAAHRARAEVDQVVVARHAIDRRILRHRRHHDAVLQHDMPRTRKGVSMGGRLRAGAGCQSGSRRCACCAGAAARTSPRSGDVARIAQAQVFVRHALAARQHRIGELLGLHRRVAFDVLEPLHRIARRDWIFSTSTARGSW
jgi:hypothetical protein